MNPGRRRRLQRARRHRKAAVRHKALMNMNLLKLKPRWPKNPKVSQKAVQFAAAFLPAESIKRLGGVVQSIRIGLRP